MTTAKRIALAFVAMLAIAPPIVAQTNIYRWTDKEGNVHFTDTPPPEEARGVTQKRMGGGTVDEGQLPFATQEAMKRNPVTLYTSNGCGEICASGRELLAERGIPFSEKNAEANRADADAVKKLIGVLEVPVLVVGEKPLKGYNEDVWQAALDGAGYPRTRLPGQVVPKPSAPAPAPAPNAPAR